LGPLNDTDTTHPDLVVANPAGDSAFPQGSISVFLQNATGFGSPTRYTGGSGPVCFGGITPGVACTVNTDCKGRCTTTGALCMIDNDCGNPNTCTEPPAGSCSVMPLGVAIGKVNSDTNFDLVVANGSTNRASFLAGSGTGAFPTVSSSVTAGSAPRYPI